MPGSVAGAYDVKRHILEIIQTYLPVELQAVMDSVNNPFHFEPPSAYHSRSYSTSPTWVAQERYNSMQVWVDSTTHVGDYLNINSVRTERVVVGVLWILFDKSPNVLEDKKQLGTAAIKRAVEKHWRENNTPAIFDVRFDPTDFRFSSLRMQGGSRRGLIGHITDTGDNVDAVIVGINCRQQVDAPQLL